MSYHENSVGRILKTVFLVKEQSALMNGAKLVDLGGYGQVTDALKSFETFEQLEDYSSSDFNVDQLPFSDGSVDFILLCEVIEHLYNPDHILREINRVLRKGGKLLISTPNLNSWFNRLLFLFGYLPLNLDISCDLRSSGKRDIFSKIPLVGVKLNPLHDVHIRLYNMKSLQILLEHHGFIISRRCSYEVSKSSNYTIGSALRFVNKLASLRTSLAQGLILIGEKM